MERKEICLFLDKDGNCTNYDALALSPDSSISDTMNALKTCPFINDKGIQCTYRQTKKRIFHE